MQFSISNLAGCIQLKIKNEAKVMLYRCMSSTRISSIVVILLSITACTHLPPRVDEFGKPKREYSYQEPIQIDDGWQVSYLAKEGVDEKIINDMMVAILAGKYPNLFSIVLVKNGSLILEEYFYYTHRYMLQEFRSAGKSVTSELMGIAIDKGFIKGVDKKLIDFFPEFKRGEDWDSRKDNVSLHHVLSMKWGFGESGPANETGWYTENWIAKILSLPLVSEPGEKFVYHSAAPAICGPIIEKTTGMPVTEFAKEYLFGPLQISDYLWHTLPDGNILTAGGMLMRPRDMAKIGYLIVNNGKWLGRPILSEEWIKQSTKAYVSDDELGYGYYWWLCKYKARNETFETIFASGHGGQRVLVVPKLKLVAVFTSKPDGNPRGHKRISQIMEKFILPSMLNSDS
jgi:CubicO group peptidase (beta-lactamase class C family)